ncbi:MAG TPA: hypothetical protein VET23_07625 [Chitinophagaceae bacterium]|nr:hypothetical protein [Chitinophagaceae bacterium]
MKQGKVYENVKVKLNLFDNTLFYITSDGNERVIISPVNEIVFSDTSSGGGIKNIVFQNGFSPVDRQNETTYYEVLDSGQVKLLKYHNINYQDKKEYNNAVITRVFNETNAWYLRLAGGTMSKLEKGKEVILSLLSSKKTEIEKFIEGKNLKCRKENDWKK